jgi:hypothetical protein
MGYNSVIDRLVSMDETLSSTPSTTKKPKNFAFTTHSKLFTEHLLCVQDGDGSEMNRKVL